MIRKIAGVILGYAIFVITSLLLFKISGHKPHAEATVTFQVLTAVYGIVFSFLSGLIVPLIAGTRSIVPNIILAFVIAAFATFSLVKADGSHWTQVMAITLFAPASFLGGYFYARRK